MSDSGFIYDVYLMSGPHAPRRHEKFEKLCSIEGTYNYLFSVAMNELCQWPHKWRNYLEVDWGFFSGDDLRFLDDIIASISQRIKGRGLDWYEKKGVDEATLKNLLATLKAGVDKARAENIYVNINFWGGGG